ncbi:helix-turn-helix domain-containing protein [Nonomuraea sp. NPDC005650]|uniref:MarR family transcriptional regulator n=1 Tax=Nonomuraea sp. NPDC005650 TaxID=3157045 RepID=UPI0033AB1412
MGIQVSEIAPGSVAGIASDGALSAAETAPTPAPDAATGDGPNARQEAVRDALLANPGASVTAIGAAAGMSRVAAGKILNELERNGRAKRIAGGHDGRGRTPDRWYPADTDDTANTPEPVERVDLPDTAEASAIAVVSDTSSDTTEDTTGLDTHQEAVLAALEGNPGWSAAAIGVMAGLTQTGVIKVLDRLVAAGLVSRGDEEDRTKDEWYPVSDNSEPTTCDETPGLDGVSIPNDPAADADESSEEQESDPENLARVEACAELVELADLILGTVRAMDGEGGAVLALGRLEMAMAKISQAHRNARAVLTGTTAPARPTAGRSGSRSSGNAGQVRPAALRDRVLGHLTEHPGKDFTPYEIGRVLDASSGAVANALDRLVSLGQAQLTCERPRRFSLAEIPASE